MNIEKLGFATVKKFNDEVYKIIYSKHAHGPTDKSKDLDRSRKGGEEKMKQNISRARSKVIEYGLCNEWEHFITLTLDGKKQDRGNLRTYHRALGYFIKNLNRRRTKKIRFLLIPELHADKKNWHMHGLIHGLDGADLDVNANGFLYWKAYGERFGYNSLSKIRNKEAVSKYILKYIGKGFNDRRVGEHLYYCSRGLSTAETVGTGHLVNVPVWDYENDYCSVVWVKEKWENWVCLSGLRVISEQ